MDNIKVSDIILIILLIIIFITPLLLLLKRNQKRNSKNDYDDINKQIENNNDKQTIDNKNMQWEFKSFRGDISEKSTVMQITEMSKLPIIQNPIIAGYNGYTSEIDIIMINECGVFVFENKSYSGRIIGKQSELKWTQFINLKKIKFYNPIMQNEKHIKVLRGQAKLNGQVPFFNIIVFGGKIDTSNVECDDTVLLTTRESTRVELYKMINKSDKILNDIEQRSIHRKIMAISRFDKEAREKHIEQVKNFVGKK